MGVRLGLLVLASVIAIVAPSSPANAVMIGDLCTQVGATSTALKFGASVNVVCVSDGMAAHWLEEGTAPAPPPSGSSAVVILGDSCTTEGAKTTAMSLGKPVQAECSSDGVRLIWRVPGAAGSGSTAVSGPLGRGWTLGPVALDSATIGFKPVDAEAVVVSGNKVRLYVERLGSKQIVSFISNDGEAFTQEDGVRLENATFPSIVRLPNGTFRMYFTRHSDSVAQTLSARSKDGLNWIVEPGVRATGEESSALRLPDGRTLLAVRRDFDGSVGCNAKTSNIYFAVSKDGLKFTDKGKVVDTVALSSAGGRAYGAELTALQSGTIALFFDGCLPQFVAPVASKKLTLGTPQTAAELRGQPVATKYGTTRIGGAGGDLTHVVFRGKDRVYFGVADADGGERIGTATR